jgi:peptide/nickel transport system substrate-binding protein
LLAEAGLEDGFEFELIAATDRSIRADTAITIQQMVSEIGIQFDVQTIDYDTYIAQVYRQAPLYIGYWGMRPTLDSQMVPFFTTDGSFNEYAYSNPELDETLFAARGELDDEARMALYQQAQQILSEEGPVLIPYFLNVTSAYRSEVAGFEAHPLTTFDLRYVSLRQ